jgi:hypothetical protein
MSAARESMDQRILRAAESFFHGFTLHRSRTYPYIITRSEGLTILHDAPRKKVQDMRRAEAITIDRTPKEVHSESERLNAEHPRWSLAAIHSDEASLESVESEYRALGYRLIAREAFFTHEHHELPNVNSSLTRRITSSEEMEMYARATGRKPYRSEDIEGQFPKIRCYYSVSEETVVGGVATILTPNDTFWVSNLWVTEERRREGRATAMMAQLLQDNAKAGPAMTVLLSSKAGAYLYPCLGFEQIGTLLLYQPPK